VVSPFPVTPDRDLGQHFLVDENILGVIGRLATLDAEDVVLEVGAGLGVLTTYLADRVALVLAVEIDRGLEPHLRERLSGYSNVRLRIADALGLDLALLEPAPSKLVANLPYSIATPLVVESLDRLPTVTRWCVMVQREVADRIVAEPASRAYGAVSVLVQLTADRAGFHPVARTCFSPPPNVDSALVALQRTRSWGPEYMRVKRVVQGAFAHRRKTVVNSLELAGVASRAASLGALETLGLPARVRAEALEPEAFVELALALP
jgi:16S rRNA (adenine1518-N6/adenine1519-N6)-dimethyltransferase